MRSGESRPLMAREGGNTRANVYCDMLLQVCRDYPGLPDPRTLTASEIRFFYEPLRPELCEATKPKG